MIQHPNFKAATAVGACLFIGQDHCGRWVVRDAQSLCGGLFANQKEAIRFVYVRVPTPPPIRDDAAQRSRTGQQSSIFAPAQRLARVTSTSAQGDGRSAERRLGDPHHIGRNQQAPVHCEAWGRGGAAVDALYLKAV